MNAGRAMAIMRIVLWFGFLYAGLEKILQIGGSGPFNAAGFLKFATPGALPGSNPKAVANPTHITWVWFMQNTALMPLINLLVQFGEVAIGVALILGIATRFSGIMGAILTGLFFVASWSFATGVVTMRTSSTWLSRPISRLLAQAPCGASTWYFPGSSGSHTLRCACSLPDPGPTRTQPPGVVSGWFSVRLGSRYAAACSQ